MTGYGIDLALTRRAITEALRNAAANVPQPTVRPGTVESNTSGIHDTVEVVVDGDLVATGMGNASGQALGAGDRVMVSFMPPNGVLCTGIIGRSSNVLLSSTAPNQSTMGDTSGAQFRTNGAGVALVEGGSFYVVSAPYSSSRHAAGKIGRYTYAPNVSLASGFVLGPSASMSFIAGREYNAHITFPNLGHAGGWWTFDFYVGATLRGSRLWLGPGLSESVDYHISFTDSTRTTTTQINGARIGGSGGNLGFNGLSGTPSIRWTVEDVGPA